MSTVLLHSIDAREPSVLRGYNTPYNFFVAICVHTFCAITLKTGWKICHICALCLLTRLTKNQYVCAVFSKLSMETPTFPGFLTSF